MKKTTITPSITEKSQGDINYEWLISIYNQIAPEQIEEAYVTLDELIVRYNRSISRIQEIKGESRTLRGLKRQKGEAESAELEARRAIMEAASTLDSDTSLKGINTILDLISTVQESKIKAQQLSKEIDEIAPKVGIEVLEEAEKTRDMIVAEMAEQMRKMSAQGITADNIGDVERYLPLIDSFDAPDHLKNMYKKILKSYVNLRMQVFKHEEEIVSSILEAQAAHEELPDLKKQEKYSVYAFASSVNIGEYPTDSRYRHLDRETPLQAFPYANAEIAVMELAAGYLETGEIDMEVLNSIPKNNLQVTEGYFPDLYEALVDSQPRKKEEGYHI